MSLNVVYSGGMNGGIKRRDVADSVREIVFGLEDSLVSTLGAVTGIAAGAGSTYMVILSGLVLVSVESLSMAAGSYLSSKSVAEVLPVMEGEEGRAEVRHIRPLRNGIVMGVFYVLGGMVPLVPYFLLPIDLAYGPSILATGLCLFALGAWTSKLAKRPLTRGGMEMVSVSLGAAVLGFIIGRAVSSAYGIQTL